MKVSPCLCPANCQIFVWLGQGAKKVVSDSPGPLDITVGRANLFLTCPMGVQFFEEFKLQKNCEINSAHQNVFGAGENDIWANN